MAIHDFDTCTSSFLEWSGRAGVQMSSKAILNDLRAEGRGRGLAIGDFEEDEIIFSIPRNAVLSVKTAIPDIEFKNLKLSPAALEDRPAWLSLTTVLMAEKLKNNSHWLPYLAVLPSNLDSLMFWSPTELAELQASAVLNKIGKLDAEAMFNERIVPLGINGFNLELFHQMASTIMAYAFDIPENDFESATENFVAEDLISDDNNQRTVLTMIPVADMLNADADRNNVRLLCDNQDLEMRSTKPIKKGEEILNDYGTLPRSDLLRRYGYITDNYALYDVVEISTSLIVSPFRSDILSNDEVQHLERLDPADLEVRLQLAIREDIYEDSYDIGHAISEDPCIPDKLIALIYILLVNRDMLSSIQSSRSTLPSRSKMATELLGAVIVKLLRMREEEYATTLEDDHAILAAGNCLYRQAMAIKIRQGEKTILRKAIAEAALFKGNHKHMRIKSLKHGVLVGLPHQSKKSRTR